MNERTKKIGLGTALVVLPVGGAIVYMQLKEAGERQNQREEDGATYDTAGMAKIDEALIKYHQAGEVATELAAPRAIALDASGRLLVAGDKVVRILTDRGVRVKDIPLDGSPECLAAADDGTIFVGFADHIEAYDEAGGRRAAWKSFGEKSLLRGLAVHGKEVLVADAGRRVVVRCGLDGTVLGEIGKEDGTQGTGLVLPSPFLNVAGTGDGQVMVSNPGRHRVDVYSSDGQLQRFFGQAGAAIGQFIGCCNPSHLALLADGRIVTAEKGIPRIKIFQPDGQLDCVVAGPEVFGISTRGFELAVDGANRVFVLEPGKTTVRIFAPNEAKASVSAPGAQEATNSR